MMRREALGLLGAAAAIPLIGGLSPRDALVLGRKVHARLDGVPSLAGLTEQHRRIVATIAEIIIPETDTPGAKAARVDDFIDVIVSEWYSEPERSRFLVGLDDVDRRSRSANGKSFTDCTAEQQVAVVAALDRELTDVREAAPVSSPADGLAGPKPNEHFFAMMKSLTVYGYYSSEPGRTLELRHQVIPGRYTGCEPIQPR